MEVQKLEQKLKIQIIDFSQGRNPQNKKQTQKELSKLIVKLTREKIYIDN